MTEPRLRVLAVTNMLPTKDSPGYGAFVADQMNWVLKCGVDVTLEFIDGRRDKGAYLRGVWRMLRQASRQRFDLVHAHYGTVGFLATFLSLPLLVSFCGDDLLGTPNGAGGITRPSRVQRALSRHAARFADGIVCKSEQMRAALPRARDRERAYVLPNGVDTARFRPGDRQAARRRLRLPPDERLVLFPHTPWVARKRLDLAKAALQRLEARGLSARLWVVQGVDHATMPDYYQAADCLLLTSDQEGSPNVVKEALCCDIPVISGAVGDVAQWLDRAPGSVLVDRDPEVIADALQRVLAGGGRCDGAQVREALSSERVTRRLIEIYEATIHRKPR